MIGVGVRPYRSAQVLLIVWKPGIWRVTAAWGTAGESALYTRTLTLTAVGVGFVITTVVSVPFPLTKCGIIRVVASRSSCAFTSMTAPDRSVDAVAITGAVEIT